MTSELLLNSYSQRVSAAGSDIAVYRNYNIDQFFGKGDIITLYDRASRTVVSIMANWKLLSARGNQATQSRVYGADTAPFVVKVQTSTYENEYHKRLFEAHPDIVARVFASFDVAEVDGGAFFVKVMPRLNADESRTPTDEDRSALIATLEKRGIRFRSEDVYADKNLLYDDNKHLRLFDFDSEVDAGVLPLTPAQLAAEVQKAHSALALTDSVVLREESDAAVNAYARTAAYVSSKRGKRLELPVKLQPLRKDASAYPVKVVEIEGKGRGLVATEDIAAGVVVAEFWGTLIDSDAFKASAAIPPYVKDQIGQDTVSFAKGMYGLVSLGAAGEDAPDGRKAYARFANAPSQGESVNAKIVKETRANDTELWAGIRTVRALRTGEEVLVEYSQFYSFKRDAIINKNAREGASGADEIQKKNMADDATLAAINARYGLTLKAVKGKGDLSADLRHLSQRIPSGFRKNERKPLSVEGQRALVERVKAGAYSIGIQEQRATAYLFDSIEAGGVDLATLVLSTWKKANVTPVAVLLLSDLDSKGIVDVPDGSNKDEHAVNATRALAKALLERNHNPSILLSLALSDMSHMVPFFSDALLTYNFRFAINDALQGETALSDLVRELHPEVLALSNASTLALIRYVQRADEYFDPSLPRKLLKQVHTVNFVRRDFFINIYSFLKNATVSMEGVRRIRFLIERGGLDVLANNTEMYAKQWLEAGNKTIRFASKEYPSDYLWALHVDMARNKLASLEYLRMGIEFGLDKELVLSYATEKFVDKLYRQMWSFKFSEEQLEVLREQKPDGTRDGRYYYELPEEDSLYDEVLDSLGEPKLDRKEFFLTKEDIEALDIVKDAASGQVRRGADIRGMTPEELRNIDAIGFEPVVLRGGRPDYAQDVGEFFEYDYMLKEAVEIIEDYLSKLKKSKGNDQKKIDEMLSKKKSSSTVALAYEANDLPAFERALDTLDDAETRDLLLRCIGDQKVLFLKLLAPRANTLNFADHAVITTLWASTIDATKQDHSLTNAYFARLAKTVRILIDNGWDLARSGDKKSTSTLLYYPYLAFVVLRVYLPHRYDTVAIDTTLALFKFAAVEGRIAVNVLEPLVAEYFIPIDVTKMKMTMSFYALPSERPSSKEAQEKQLKLIDAAYGGLGLNTTPAASEMTNDVQALARNAILHSNDIEQIVLARERANAYVALRDASTLGSELAVAVQRGWVDLASLLVNRYSKTPVSDVAVNNFIKMKFFAISASSESAYFGQDQYDRMHEARFELFKKMLARTPDKIFFAQAAIVAEQLGRRDYATHLRSLMEPQPMVVDNPPAPVPAPAPLPAPAPVPVPAPAPANVDEVLTRNISDIDKTSTLLALLKRADNDFTTLLLTTFGLSRDEMYLLAADMFEMVKNMDEFAAAVGGREQPILSAMRRYVESLTQNVAGDLLSAAVAPMFVEFPTSSGRANQPQVYVDTRMGLILGLHEETPEELFLYQWKVSLRSKIGTVSQPKWANGLKYVKYKRLWVPTNSKGEMKQSDQAVLDAWPNVNNVGAGSMYIHERAAQRTNRVSAMLEVAPQSTAQDTQVAVALKAGNKPQFVAMRTAEAGAPDYHAADTNSFALAVYRERNTLLFYRSRNALLDRTLTYTSPHIAFSLRDYSLVVVHAAAAAAGHEMDWYPVGDTMFDLTKVRTMRVPDELNDMQPLAVTHLNKIVFALFARTAADGGTNFKLMRVVYGDDATRAHVQNLFTLESDYDMRAELSMSQRFLTLTLGSLKGRSTAYVADLAAVSYPQIAQTNRDNDPATQTRLRKEAAQRAKEAAQQADKAKKEALEAEKAKREAEKEQTLRRKFGVNERPAPISDALEVRLEDMGDGARVNVTYSRQAYEDGGATVAEEDGSAMLVGNVQSKRELDALIEQWFNALVREEFEQTILTIRDAAEEEENSKEIEKKEEEAGTEEEEEEEEEEEADDEENSLEEFIVDEENETVARLAKAALDDVVSFTRTVKALEIKKKEINEEILNYNDENKMQEALTEIADIESKGNTEENLTTLRELREFVDKIQEFMKKSTEEKKVVVRLLRRDLKRAKAQYEEALEKLKELEKRYIDLIPDRSETDKKEIQELAVINRAYKLNKLALKALRFYLKKDTEQPSWIDSLKVESGANAENTVVKDIREELSEVVESYKRKKFDAESLEGEEKLVKTFLLQYKVPESAYEGATANEKRTARLAQLRKAIENINALRNE